jgi:predicted  nucleic acid-binding Zn-ribbon protein
LLEQIRLLIKLQAVDKCVFDLEKELREMPERITQLQSQEAKITQELGKLNDELRVLRKQRKDLEDETEIVRARVRKAETKLMNSKNQREHMAATAELDEGRDILRSNDDLLLSIMEKQEPLEKKAAQLTAQIAEQLKQLAEARTQMEQRSAEARKILEEVTQGRDQTEKLVEKPILREYDFIRSRRQGIAISPVSKGNCGICHMQISPQQFNELQKAEQLMYCPSCKRIIYWADDEHFHA